MAVSPNKKIPLCEYIKEQLPYKPNETICRALGIPNFHEGHFIAKTTIVEVNSRGQVVTVGCVMPKAVPLEKQSDVEVVPEAPEDPPEDE